MYRLAAGITTRIAKDLSTHLQSTSVLVKYQNIYHRLFSTEEGRRLVAACVLERLPVVVPEDPLYEIEYHELKERLFSKYRRELPSEFTKVTGGESGDTPEGDAGDTSFSFASRITEADEQNDVKSLRRALHKRLFFLVRSKGEGGKEVWHFPQRGHEAGQTIKQAAEGALEGVLTADEGRQVYFIGNSPAGHGRYPDYDMFFHRAQLIKGSVALQPGGGPHDYAWVTKEELPQYIEDPNAQTLFSMILAGP